MAQYGFKAKGRTSRSTVDGKVIWVEKAPAPILVCECGTKYIKTRRGQTECVWCMAKQTV